MGKFITPSIIVAAAGLIAGLPIVEATADAQRGGGRAGGARSAPQVRSQSSSSINHRGTTQAASRGSQNANRGANVNRSTNVNRNTNVNIDRDVNVDIDNDWDNDWDHHPVARGAAIAATTAIVVGATYRALPPACTTTVVNGISYSQCGGYWYQPRYVGSSVEYVVVNSPY